MGDWEACGEAFYSRELLYDMAWEDTDLDSKRWVGAINQNEGHDMMCAFLSTSDNN